MPSRVTLSQVLAIGGQDDHQYLLIENHDHTYSIVQRYNQTLTIQTHDQSLGDVFTLLKFHCPNAHSISPR